MIATTELCPLDDIQAAATRMFPRDEASQTDVVSYVWERWSRLSQVPMAMALAEARRFAFRMRRRERSPLCRPTEEIDRHCRAGERATWPEELIERLPASLRIVATLLASGHSRAEVARLLATSKATIWRQCNQIAAYIER